MDSSSIVEIRKGKKTSVSPLNIITAVVLMLYCVIFVALLLWGVLTSLKNVEYFYDNPLGLPVGWPWQWEWSNFSYIMKNFYVPVTIKSGIYAGVQGEVRFLSLIVNTLLYTVPSALIATFIPCLTAYLVARYKYFLSKIVYMIVIITMILPIVGNYPSEIQLLQTLHLYDTYIGLWLQKANFLGMYFLVFYAVFKNAPNEFAEAAHIDGASEFTVFWRIMLPLARTTFLTVMLIRFIEFWNDYQIPLLYMPTKPTLSYGLFYLYTSSKNELSSPPMSMAGTIIIIIPIMIIFLAFKNRLMGNITMGGLKG